MKKTISLITLLGAFVSAFVSGSVFADVKQGFQVENLTINQLWVNVGDAPAKPKESPIHPRGYKIIKPNETKRWSYLLGNLQTWDPEKTKLWIRTPNSKVAYGFAFPPLQTINKLTINSEKQISLTGKKVDWLTLQPTEKTTQIIGKAQDLE